MKPLLLLLLSTVYLFASQAFITPTELKQELNDKNLVLLDVTDPKTYAASHIPNAVNINAFDLRYKVDKYQLMKPSKEIEKIFRSYGINNDSKVVIYGHAKPKDLLKCSYTALALITNGHNNVSILDGGFPAWTYDFPKIVSHKIPTVKEGNFIAKFNPNILVDLNYVKARIHKVPMIESRPSRYYYGTDQSKGVKRLGHIPGAMTSFWKDKFNSDEEILDMKDLKDIFIKHHKLSPDKEVIVYCTGGLEASMNWYVLHQHLKFKNVKIYDASMREWGNRDDTPMTLKE